MAIQPGEWEYLYQTSPATQIPWEQGGPDVCLVQLVERKVLPSRGAVLDLGCGLGSAAVYLAALGYHVTGIDLSPTAIAKATRKAEQVGVTVTFHVGDALASQLPARAFEIVYDRGCLQHIARDQRSRYRDEVLRLLKPKGHYVVEVAQELLNLDEFKQLFGRALTIKQTTSVTHVERPTGIPRYHLLVYAQRR